MEKTLFVIMAFSAMLLLSCESNNSDSNKTTTDSVTSDSTLVIDTLSSNELGEINNIALNNIDTTDSRFETTAAKGDLWLGFINAFRSCWQDETFKSNIVYLGPSNAKYLGTVLSKDKATTWATLESVGIDSNDLKKFINVGVDAPQNCSSDKFLKNYFKVLLAGNYGNTIDGNLSVAIQNANEFRMLTGKWRVDDINFLIFNNFLDTCKKESVILYKKNLERNKLLLTKVLVLTDFSAEVQPSRSLDASLGVKLDSTINATTSLNAGVDLSFKRVSGGKILVNGKGTSYVIGMLQKVKKIIR